jgi:hypothetical protein
VVVGEWCVGVRAEWELVGADGGGGQAGDGVDEGVFGGHCAVVDGDDGQVGIDDDAGSRMSTGRPVR